MRDLLDIKLLTQPFETTSNPGLQLENARLIARMYTKMENSMAVLSDMRARKSYLYYGAVAEQLGLDQQESEINSIWEDQLLSRVHPEDLQKKYRLEFQFFQLLNALEVNERSDYEVITRLRIRNREGRYLMIQHRLLYISSAEDGSVWLALCLYNRIYDHPEFGIPQGLIINKRSGEILEDKQNRFNELLSLREAEVLQLIRHGRRSKEIAAKLGLSIHTVNRHRQNIFEKLNVTNALEACRVAESIGLL